jgi:glycosyltransferase involved in cell wall biosynthesis
MTLCSDGVDVIASCPRISVITPSFNQAQFLERTMRSVLDQAYPNLEYIVIDGGSTDGSVEVIRKYADHLAYWVSEPDSGQVAAINKGLLRATGEWVCWQNSDDIFFPGAFHSLAKVVSKYPKAGLIIGNMMLIDEADRPLRDLRYVTPNYGAMLAEGMLLANQAAFWRSNARECIGLLNENYHCSFDYDWFLRLTAEYRGVHVNQIWGGLRLHGATKTSHLGERFTEENRLILAGREVPQWKRRLYQVRRLVQMLSQGELGYALRGILRRARIADGGHG